MGPRFFIIDKPLTTGQTIRLTTDDSHHAFKVLRLQIGDFVEISDGKGKCFEAEVTDASKVSVEVLIIEQINEKTEPPIDITLMQGLLKGRKMDLVVHQAVELGVTRIIPLVTRRSVPVLKDKDNGGGKAGRWQKIAQAAAAQCRRGIIPLVEAPLLLEELDLKYGLKDELILAFWEEGKDKGIPFAKMKHKNSGISVIVGPEGGFDAIEIEFLKQKGVLVAGLGPRVLRAETAAVVALALVQAGLGDLQKGEAL